MQHHALHCFNMRITINWSINIYIQQRTNKLQTVFINFVKR